MFDRKRSFVEDCLAGDALLSDIDDYVERWHQGEGLGELHEFLGMTKEEYATWVEKPNSLRAIMLAHKNNIDLQSALDWCSADRMAARGVDADEAREILEWLKRTGRMI